ncbi:MAG TPA: hypothetical protein VKN76_01445, partial [Kiloniellaceae bacterium]|nr:hypothetical protein [Kiloniellaceae bacterium]
TAEADSMHGEQAAFAPRVSGVARQRTGVSRAPALTLEEASAAASLTCRPTRTSRRRRSGVDNRQQADKDADIRGENADGMPTPGRPQKY